MEEQKYLSSDLIRIPALTKHNATKRTAKGANFPGTEVIPLVKFNNGFSLAPALLG